MTRCAIIVEISFNYTIMHSSIVVGREESTKFDLEATVFVVMPARRGPRDHPMVG